jgi:hypothetical protein
MEVMMKRRLATVLAAAAVFAAGAAIAPSAFAGGNFALSVTVPGFSAGYSSGGYGYVAAAPVPYYAAPYYAAAPVVTYSAPVVYAPYAPYYRPYARTHVGAPYVYRAPVRVAYYGHYH